MSSDVEEVKQRTDIVQVIGERIKLSKAGRNYKALCPFHGEKTPSFMVSSELQVFKCFGCGEGGDVFTFLQKYEGIDFFESLKLLADKVGYRLHKKPHSPSYDKEPLFEAMEAVQKFYSYLLFNHSQAKGALDYLINERQLSEDTIKHFGIGFCPDIPFAMRKYVDKKGIDYGNLVKAGVLIHGSGGYIDRFRGRITFPIHDHLGRIVAFSGRVLPNARKEVAKYINSPETVLYHKSKILYGLNLSKNFIKKANKAILVEGELDLISVWQAGFKNVVAVKGSAFTKKQSFLISRFTNNLLFAFDKDEAGIKAVRSALDNTQDLGIDLYVLDLKESKDPDDMVRNDLSAFKKSVDAPMPLWDFLIETTIDKYGSDGSFSKISRELIPILLSINDSIVQDHYVGKLAEKLNVSHEAVYTELQKRNGKKTEIKYESKKDRKRELSREEILEERLLSAALVTNPKLLLDRKVVAKIKIPKFRKIIEALESYLSDTSKFSAKDFIEFLPKELGDVFAQVLLRDAYETEVYEKEFEEVLNEIEKVGLEAKIKKISKSIKEAEGKGSSDLAKLLDEFDKASKRLQLTKKRI